MRFRLTKTDLMLRCNQRTKQPSPPNRRDHNGLQHEPRPHEQVPQRLHPDEGEGHADDFPMPRQHPEHDAERGRDVRRPHIDLQAA